MANATADRVGQVNGSGSVSALFLTQFGGEIMGIFQRALVAMPRHLVRDITGGMTAQFPAYGTASAAYHTVGAEIVGQAINHAQRTISVDDMLVADYALAQIDDLMNHYDFRGPITSELAHALAKKADTNILQVALNAARASATVTGGSAGTVVTDADGDTNAASFIASIYSAAQTMDEKNVPDVGRSLFVKPAQFYLLAQNTTLLSRDYSATAGDIAKGTPTPSIANFEVVKTNSVPTSNIASGPTAYQGNFSTSFAVGSTPQAVGTVKLLDLVPEITWDPRRLVWLITARYAMGHGILRPECAVEFKTS